MLSRLKKLFTPAPRDTGIYVHVRCAKCGEKIRVRVDPSNDLSGEYDGNDRTTGYFCNKNIIGSGCHAVIHAGLYFNVGRELVERTIENGEFITEEEYRREDNSEAQGA